MKKENEQELITAFYKFTIRELMDTAVWDLPVVEKSADITTIFSILSGKSHIWVVDSKQTMKVVGVITEHDMLSLLSPAYEPSYISRRLNLRSLQYDLTTAATEIMSKKPITISPDDKVTDALAKMNHYRVRRLPVVDDNNVLLGEITLHHLIYRYHNEQTKNLKTAV
jgi:CBS domain-containing protein